MGADHLAHGMCSHAGGTPFLFCWRLPDFPPGGHFGLPSSPCVAPGRRFLLAAHPPSALGEEPGGLYLVQERKRQGSNQKTMASLEPLSRAVFVFCSQLSDLALQPEKLNLSLQAALFP